MKWYSIRVVNAPVKDRAGAVEQVILQRFCEEERICDKVLTKKEIKRWILSGKLPLYCRREAYKDGCL